MQTLSRLSLLVALALTKSPLFAEDLTKWVDPFIGTGGDGHTFPGAVVPFGMVQLSPDTDNPMRGVSPQSEIYKRCAGYHFDDSTIVGFSHTHFSGTGHSDLGDLLIMPMTGKPQTSPGTAANPDSGYRSRFSHKDEAASPGYYRVKLTDYQIDAELTATARTGMHRYSFPKTDQGHVLIDLTHGIYNFSNKVIWSDVRVVDNSTLIASRRSNGWAHERPMYFAIRFSRPFDDIQLINEDNTHYRCMGCLDNKNAKHSTIVNSQIPFTAGKAVKVLAHFNNPHEAPLLIKVGVSAVDKSNALENLIAEVPHWDFDKVKNDAKSKWQTELERMKAKGSDSQKRQFYTALYHALQAPSLYQDVNGEYLGIDGEIHKANFTHYTLFSLWDTYRALHPLLTLVSPERVPDMINSMLAHYDQSYDRILPIWSFHGHETWTMIGYHAVSVISDAWQKGIRGFDGRRALDAMTATANHAKYDAIPEYLKFGYVPMDVLPESVSITLEYAYDDFAIARMAQSMGETSIANTFDKRAHNWRNVFDPQTKFARGRDSAGNWDKDFDVEEAKYMGPFTEGNSFQYSFYVPHDMAGLIDTKGGDAAFIGRLDELFTRPLHADKIKEHEDIAGLIGQYAHGNEPSHHIAYLYNHAGAPWMTQYRIRQIMDTLSNDTPSGLAGNDDVGQMSAWYIFSAMGFYPVTPGDMTYVIGAPQLPEISLTLGNGKRFTVIAKGLSQDKLYIAKATLNGMPLTTSYLHHNDIMAGGELVFEMSARANKEWGKDIRARPKAMSSYKN